MLDNKKEITDPKIRIKKTYRKPAISRVQLVAEDAVLSACKDGNYTTCSAQAMTCISTIGS